MEKGEREGERERNARGVDADEVGFFSFFLLPFSLLLIKKQKKLEKQKKTLNRYDANVSLPGCDKNMPGTIIAAARLDRPSLMIYGGTIKPGVSKGGEPLDIVSAFQSYGARSFFFLSFFAFRRAFSALSLSLPLRRLV